MIDLDSLESVNNRINEINKDVKNIQDSVKENIFMLNKRASIEIGQTKDFGKDSFNLTLTFDEINIENWKTITDNIYSLLVVHRQLRKERFYLEQKKERLDFEKNKAELVTGKTRLINNL